MKEGPSDTRSPWQEEQLFYRITLTVLIIIQIEIMHGRLPRASRIVFTSLAKSRKLQRTERYRPRCFQLPQKEHTSESDGLSPIVTGAGISDVVEIMKRSPVKALGVLKPSR